MSKYMVMCNSMNKFLSFQTAVFLLVLLAGLVAGTVALNINSNKGQEEGHSLGYGTSPEADSPHVTDEPCGGIRVNTSGRLVIYRPNESATSRDVKDPKCSEPFWNLEDGPNQVALADVLEWFSDDSFFCASSVASTPCRVVRAKEILLQCFEEGYLERRFTPEQLTAIVWRESKCWDRQDPSRTVVNLRTLGDRKLRHKAYGAFQLRYVAWGEVIIDKDRAMPFPDEIRQELRSLGIKDSDFYDPLLSLLVFEAWHHRYSSPSMSFAQAAGTYNAGPTGYKRSRGRGYASAVSAKADKLLAQRKAETQSPSVAVTE